MAKYVIIGLCAQCGREVQAVAGEDTDRLLPHDDDEGRPCPNRVPDDVRFCTEDGIDAMAAISEAHLEEN